MTYGLQIVNASNELVISSDSVNYKYAGSPTLVSSGSVLKVNNRYTLMPYKFTMQLPSGAVLYPLIGIKLDATVIVELGVKTIEQPTSINWIYGLAGVVRVIDTTTGFMYKTSDTTLTGESLRVGERMLGQRNGPLSIRNGAIYEWDNLAYYLNGRQMMVLDTPYYHDPLVYTPATLTISVNSVNVLGSSSLKTTTVSRPTIYVFTPYTPSDGESGYGLNLYNSLGNLSFSSNKQLLTIDQTVDFIENTTTLNAQTVAWNPLSTAIILNGEGIGDVSSEKWNRFNTESTANFYGLFGYTYTGNTVVRMFYSTELWPPISTYTRTSITSSRSAVKILIVDGTGLVPSTNFTGYLASAGSDVTSQGTYPQGIAISPDRQHVYVTNTSNSSIVQYNRTSSGSLNTPRGIYTSGGPNNGGANWPVVSPDGTCVYVACPTGPAGGTVDRFTRDLSTGNLTYTSSWSVPTCYFIAISPDGLNLYASSFSGATPISIFTIDSDGNLIPYTTMAAPETNAGCFSWTISSDGLSVYLCLYLVNEVAVYKRDPDTGALTYQQLVSTNNYQVGTYPSYSALSPDGKFFYVSNYGNNSITVYIRNSESDSPAYATLLYSSYILTDANPAGIVISLDGKFLYCAMFSSNLIKVYTRNALNGTLALHSTISTGGAPYALAISSDDASIYTANQVGNSVGQYNRSIS